jgi:hypothetical protein
VAHRSTVGPRVHRTRTVSLGICTIRAAVQPDLRDGVFATDRERPPVTEVTVARVSAVPACHIA